MKPGTLAAFLALLAISLACASQTPAPIPTLRSSPYDLGRTLYGFFPSPQEVSTQSVLDTYKATGEHGDVVLLQQNIPWEDFAQGAEVESKAILDIHNQFLLAHQNNLEVIFVVDPLNGLNRREFSGLPRGWLADFANPNVRAAFTNYTLRIVREFHLRYLGLASEINTYADAHPEDFPNFLSLYAEVYDRVKAEAPETQIFVTFQWEDLNNLMAVAAEGRSPYQTNWETVEAFEPRLDLWVISSYPFVVFPNGAAIPPDYYTPLLSRTMKPLAVAEGGYTSGPVGPFPGDALDQIGYLNAIHAQLGGSRLAFWIYLLLTDFNLDSYARVMRSQGIADPDINTLGLFASVGLRAFDGEPKPGLELWDRIRKGRKTSRGERLLGIDVTEARDSDYDAAFRLARSTGAQIASLSLAWEGLETVPGKLDPDPNYLAIANLYYPPLGAPLDLMIAPIDTNHLRLPAGLRNRPFDDPLVIQRFNQLLEAAFDQIPDVALVSLSIGNEVDAYLGTDQALWEQYTRFFQAVGAHARSLRPGLKVGVKGTFSGIMGASRPYFQALNAFSDVTLVTYYPLNDDFTVKDPAGVQDDFEALIKAYPEKPIYFLEAGYPSSPDCNSSEEKQAEFVRQVFAAWDRHADRIPVVHFTWLHDLPPSSVKDYEQYYGLSDPRFAAYLASLGFRTYDGKDKLAFKALRDEAGKRGW